MIGRMRYYYSRFGFSGIGRVLMAKLTRRPTLLEVRGHGLRHPLMLRCHTSDLPTFDQVFLQNEYSFSVTRPPATIIDAGANIGLASVYFAKKYPDARIIAIEPESSNYELLKLNLAPYENVVPLKAALWVRDEPLDLVDPGLGKWGFRTKKPGDVDSAPTRVVHSVRGMTVDTVMKEYGLEQVDLLKIDIEGSELELFTDTSQWLHKVGALVIELHERHRPGCNRSFYAGSDGFDYEWQQGENLYLTRSGGCLARPS